MADALSEAAQIETPALKAPVTMRDALRAKYSLPHHVLLWEVRNSTGFDSSRSADALAITMYVSRGHALTGFEIKDHRSDWLAELKRPEKAEAIAQFCDFFFLVTSNKTIAKLDEIPHPWGWLAFTGAKLTVMKKAEKLKCVALDRAMLCSLIYCTMQRFRAEVQKEIEETVAQRVANHRSWEKDELDSAKREVAKLSAFIEEYEQASGVKLQYRYGATAQKIGEAVRLVLSGDRVLDRHRADLRWIKQRSENIAAQVTKELEQLPPELNDVDPDSEKV